MTFFHVTHHTHTSAFRSRPAAVAGGKTGRARRRLPGKCAISAGLLLGVLAAAVLPALSGCAPVVLVGATAGTTAVAADRRTTGTYVEDGAIEVKARLALSEQRELSKRVHINFTSYNTSVLVSGEAPTEADRQAVIDLVREVDKVSNVYNEITVAAPSSMLSRSGDTLITSKIKTKMFANRELSAAHIKVVTENGVAYLMGLVSQEEADLATEIARKTGGVEKVVRLFEIREPEPQ